MLDIERSSTPQFFGLPYLRKVIDEDNKIVGFFLIESRTKDEPARDLPINRDPTNGDRSLQLFLLHILPLCNVWQHWNTCVSRVMQVYVATENFSSRKLECKLLYIYFRLSVIVYI